jgi:hypothetical protein
MPVRSVPESWLAMRTLATRWVMCSASACLAIQPGRSSAPVVRQGGRAARPPSVARPRERKVGSSQAQQAQLPTEASAAVARTPALGALLCPTLLILFPARKTDPAVAPVRQAASKEALLPGSSQEERMARKRCPARMSSLVR